MKRHPAGFTLTELAACLFIICGITYLIYSAITAANDKGRMTRMVSNMMKLQSAARQMESDGLKKGDTNLSWPTETPGSFSRWVTALVHGGYLSTTNLALLLSDPDKPLPLDQIPTANTNAILVYAITPDSPTNTISLSSANFTNTPTGGLLLNPSAKPLGNAGFVVLRKSGDGAILATNAIGNTNIIGPFAPLCR